MSGELTDFAISSAIPYVKEEQAEAATKDPYVKLVLRLIDCHVVDPGRSLHSPMNVTRCWS